MESSRRDRLNTMAEHTRSILKNNQNLRAIPVLLCSFVYARYNISADFLISHLAAYESYK